MNYVWRGSPERQLRGEVADRAARVREAEFRRRAQSRALIKALKERKSRANDESSSAND